MTPKIKAIQLVKKMALNDNWGEKCQGECIDAALIAVHEILEATKQEYQIRYTSGEWSRSIGYKYSEYWKEVKTEIEKL